MCCSEMSLEFSLRSQKYPSPKFSHLGMLIIVKSYIRTTLFDGSIKIMSLAVCRSKMREREKI